MDHPQLHYYPHRLGRRGHMDFHPAPYLRGHEGLEYCWPLRIVDDRLPMNQEHWTRRWCHCCRWRMVPLSSSHNYSRAVVDCLLERIVSRSPLEKRTPLSIKPGGGLATIIFSKRKSPPASLGRGRTNHLRKKKKRKIGCLLHDIWWDRSWALRRNFQTPRMS